MYKKTRAGTLVTLLALLAGLLTALPGFSADAPRHRVIVSTDIGGSDPDDFQSMVHLLLYSDVLDIEGLVSSPSDRGRKQDILDVIDLYEADFPNLRTWSDSYPAPDELRGITKQGAIEIAPYAGFAEPTEGSQWIIARARSEDPRPLHILVWGGIEDLAQALHDAPDILPKLRVYFIGGPNKKWSPDAYQYIVEHHPDLWIIEANSTYRGWFVGGNQMGEWGNQAFVTKYIANRGALGEFFATQLDGTIKMGDSPSVGWLLQGTPADPSQPGWGGQFVRAWARPHVVIDRFTTGEDQIEQFGIFELVLPVNTADPGTTEASMVIENQTLAGFVDSEGNVHFRFSPKSAKTYSYTIVSDAPALNGKIGKITAFQPSPDAAKEPDKGLQNWWTDNPAPEFTEESHQGVKTVNRWREDFLGDFAARMERTLTPANKPRVIVTSDGEIDDECSMVRFLLYANEWDIEGIVTSSSQYHWQGHKWAGDDWVQPYLEAYAKIYPNLLEHDSHYPAPEFLQARTFLGNVKAAGEMEEVTAGSQHIVKVLLDESDDRPIWIQAWGGTNTIARALKTIEEEHPEKMAYVANKIRFFFIWEQDTTYQDYIRAHWGKYNIQTIISDQFIALFYHWKKYLPPAEQTFLEGSWMKENILQNHGDLCSLYKAHENGDFRSEGDSPAFLHTIPTGLRSLENPGWGGWGGRYTRVRDNTWLDPVADPDYQYPEGRWFTESAWGRSRLREEIPNDRELTEYLKPIWRWTEAIQNDFAARADWSVRPYKEANHPPVVVLGHAADLEVRPGETVKLSALGTSDPDGDELQYRWWQYLEAGTYDGFIGIQDAGNQETEVTVPEDAGRGETIHIIAEVTDNGSPPLTRYQRVVLSVNTNPPKDAAVGRGLSVRPWGGHYLSYQPGWYASSKARAIADNLIDWQSPEGAWPKNVDLTTPATPEAIAQAVADGKANTIDNNATTVPMRFIAQVVQATGDAKYRASFDRGLDYLFAAQYDNGGWPQFFPLREGYYSHITFNDDAMMNVMFLLRDVAAGQAPYSFVDQDRRARATNAVQRGIDCILKTQVKVDGKLTAWSAQHDEVTLAPAWARNFEPPTLSGQESVPVIRFLMEIEDPAPDEVAAIEGAVAWLNDVAIYGLNYQRISPEDGGEDGFVVIEATAGPLWARFYEIGSNRPVFTGRDKVIHYSLDEIERERRAGYSYYGSWGESLLAVDYPDWQYRQQADHASIVRIMPLGDSITYDNRRKDMRPTGARLAYRYTLHELLKSGGYSFDFVGSENAGARYLGEEMDDNAGFPGITDDQLAVLISTGFAGHTSTQVTPGPYLDSYPADIILLHIGTNKVDPSPDDVQDLLDNIRKSDPDVFIIMARIINRYPYDEVTNSFNDNVEAMVKARRDKRIVIVDMEHGAGIDYYTDMDDDLHPNHLGYDKMAAVWFEALVDLLATPEFSGMQGQ